MSENLINSLQEDIDILSRDKQLTPEELKIINDISAAIVELRERRTCGIIRATKPIKRYYHPTESELKIRDYCRNQYRKEEN